VAKVSVIASTYVRAVVEGFIVTVAGADTFAEISSRGAEIHRAIETGLEVRLKAAVDCVGSYCGSLED